MSVRHRLVGVLLLMLLMGGVALMYVALCNLGCSVALAVGVTFATVAISTYTALGVADG